METASSIKKDLPEGLYYRSLPLKQEESRDNKRNLKRGIWFFFLLLIFEGALRKWFLPELATPLLVVRDPIAIWLVFKAWKSGFLPANFFQTGMVLIGILGTFTAIFMGHGNLPVAIYGARILVIHFPLIFVIGNVFSREEVVKIGKVALLISIPMTVLIALQYFSPQSAWVNRGLGGDMEGGGFNAGALGYYRPPGTFSFTMGVVNFYSLVGCFIIYFWFKSNGINKILLVVSTICLVAAIPLSISRSLLFGVVVTFIFVLIATFRKPEFIGRIMLVCFGLVIGLGILSTTNLFQTSIEVFFSRFEIANDAEGGLEGTLVDRYLGEMINAVTEVSELSFFGYGIGMGTNVGSMLLTGGTGFTIAEGEWGIAIGELGTLIGMFYIFLRLGFCLKLTISCYKMMLKGDLLPWILLSYCLLIIPQGQWGRPTTLGFSTLIAGLTIASWRISNPNKTSPVADAFISKSPLDNSHPYVK